MKIRRLLTKGLAKTDKTVYDLFDWEPRSSELRNDEGGVLFRQEGIMVPSAWSQVATDILAQKYLKRRGVPKETITVPEEGILPKYYRSIPKDDTEFGRETSVKQVVHRIVGCWTYWFCKEGYAQNEEDADAFYDELAYGMLNQMFAPNSPQWFNTGLGWSYGILVKDPGYYYFDKELGEVSEVHLTPEKSICRQQISACFINKVEDSMLDENGIYDNLLTETRVFKRGSGMGQNWSALRAKNEKLSGGGTSSGLMSFLRILDRNADAVKSGGATRRSAKMVILDMDHPEIEDFVQWKLREEQKVASLISGAKTNQKWLNRIMSEWIKLGSSASASHPNIKKLIQDAVERNVEINYIQRAINLAKQGIATMPFVEMTNDFNDEAYHTVSGQNSNNSVSIRDDFMSALIQQGARWSLINRVDGSVAREIDPKDLWNMINYSTWSSGDPGLQFRTTINAWNTLSNDDEIRASNPCSEYLSLDGTSCNLASLRLTKFYDNQSGIFNLDAYQHYINLITMALEISVSSGIFPSKMFAEKTYQYRQLGIGYCDAGALLMRQGVPYDHPLALTWLAVLTALLTGQAYKTSSIMAKESGTFDRFEANRVPMLRVIRNHRAAAYDAVEEYDGLNIIPPGINIDHCPEYLLVAARKIWDEVLEMGERFGFRNSQSSVLPPTGTIGLVMDCDTTGIEPDFSLIKLKKLSGGGYLKIVNQSVPDALRALGYTEKQIDRVIDYIAGASTFFGCPHINPDSLKKAGFTDVEISALEKSLCGSFHISYCFNKHVLGEHFCQDILRLTEEQLNSREFSILHALGFNDAQIREANDYVNGRGTIEGAPYVTEEHYAIFDCANRCGEYGTRYINYLAHIRAVAAVQPFLSGAVSKSINVPEDATIQDIDICHREAHRLGLKGVAVYRDGSKISAPLNSNSGISFDEILRDVDVMDQVSDSLASPKVAARERLPKKREAVIHEFMIDGHKFFMTTGHYPDGRLGEVFMEYAEENSFGRTALNLLAKIMSISLQYGVPLDEFTDTMRRVTQDPRGLVQHDNVKVGKSPFDVMGKILAFEELGDDGAVENIDHHQRKEAAVYFAAKEKLEVIEDNIPKPKKANTEPCTRCGSTQADYLSSCSKRCISCGYIYGSCAG